MALAFLRRRRLFGGFWTQCNGWRKETNSGRGEKIWAGLLLKKQESGKIREKRLYKAGFNLLGKKNKISSLLNHSQSAGGGACV